MAEDATPIAKAVQAGQTPVCTLWDAVKGLAAWYWKRYPDEYLAARAVDRDDLMQESYIAMADALETFDAEKASFTTHFVFYLRHAGRHLLSKRVPACSLDEPISSEDDATLADIMPADADTARDAIEAVYREELHQHIEAALERLPKDEGCVVRFVVRDGGSRDAAAIALGLTKGQIATARSRGLHRLRHDPEVWRIACDEINEYRSRGRHSIEHLLIARENRCAALSRLRRRNACANKPE